MLTHETLKHILGDAEETAIEDMMALFTIASPKRLKANEVYIREGERSKKLAFIERGIIRTYGIKSNGDEATLLLRWEGQFIASHDSIIQGQPSRFIYHALEDTSILELDYDALEKLLREKPKYEPLRTFFLMKMLAESLEFVESFIMLSPEERYLKLTAEKPNILNRVPDKYIASLLGITPVSLSRMRRRLAERY